MKASLRRFTALAAAAVLLQITAALAQQSTSPPANAPIVVHIKDYAYQPADLTVKTGDSVEFVNDDDVAHTVTAKDGSFDSKNLDPHAHWTSVFSKPGTYPYVCSYHPGMAGSITVTK